MVIRKGMLLALSTLLCIGILYAPASVAAEKTLNIRYAGIVSDTAVNRGEDIVPISVTDAAGKGTFGRSDVSISSDFAPADVDCPTGYDQEFAMVYAVTVLTFPDHSQLFAIAMSGKLCADSLTGLYLGDASGVFAGGTGRFEDATGPFYSEFSGVNLDIGYRSIKGTLTGGVVTP